MDHIERLEAEGYITAAVAQSMRETVELTAEPCATCNAGRGRWCDHRAAAAGRRTLAGEIGTGPHGQVSR